MNSKQAYEILGSRTQWELAPMIKALNAFGGFFNTPEEEARLVAAKWARRNWQAYCAEMQARLEKKGV